MRISVVVLVAVVGCATPYQESGFSGGYTNAQLSPGVWSVQVDVNSYTSQGTALEYAYRRAGEICAAGFDVMDGTKTQSDFYIRTSDTTAVNAPKSNVSIIVRCRESEVERLARDERDQPQPVVVDTAWWCTRTNVSAGGACFRGRALCDAYRDRMAAQNPDLALTGCRSQNAVGCFDERERASGSAIQACTSTLAECRAFRDYVTAQDTGHEVLSVCGPVQ
jgi:hypothetical protein